jgi:hypothetical protein
VCRVGETPLSDVDWFSLIVPGVAVAVIEVGATSGRRAWTSPNPIRCHRP